jgi:hypothetical protein
MAPSALFNGYRWSSPMSQDCHTQLAWRFLRFQKQQRPGQWFAARAADGRASTRKTMIVALARKLLVALWRLVTTGEVPQRRRVASGVMSDSMAPEQRSNHAANAIW